MGLLDDIETTTREISVDNIELAREQVRQEKVGEDIDELAANIDKIGLLYPVIVAQIGGKKDRWELLAGQRRYLAVKQHLKWKTITAKCIDQEVTDEQALQIGASENFLQQRMTSNDWKNTCNKLWDIYRSFPKIEEVTGLKRDRIKRYVKGARLAPELKELEGKGYSLDLLIKAQDSTEDKGIPNPERAVELVKKLQPLDDDARNRSFKLAKGNPHLDVDEVIKEAEKPPPAKVSVRLTFDGTEAERLQTYAEQEQATVNDAVRNIVSGFLEDSVESE